MEMIGWVERGINIDHDEEVLSEEVGSIIASANMHSYEPSIPTDGDGYYTNKEVVKSLVGALGNHSSVGTTCGCISHQNVETFGNQNTQKDLYKLMRILGTMNYEQR